MSATSTSKPASSTYGGYETPEPAAPQKGTSITAHVTLMGSVTMAFSELETLRDIVERGVDFQNSRESLVAREFCEAVSSLR